MTKTNAKNHATASTLGFEAERWRPSNTGGGQRGHLNLGECLDNYSDQRLALIIAPMGDGESATYTRGADGFVMTGAGECPASLHTPSARATRTGTAFERRTK